MKRMLLMLAMLLCVSAHAQPYPNRPIKFIVPFPPGGNLDFIARTIQPKLSEASRTAGNHRQQGGAGGIIGAEYASKQPADGYTIFLATPGRWASTLRYIGSAL
jgi:tripartite-type tricarboxylate transporter receptor subunit TctC